MTDDELTHYSRALDEIWMLRRALACEAAITEAHLTLKSFPKSRRLFAEQQVDRMRMAARGKAGVAYVGQKRRSMDSAMKEAGASDHLTRSSWEAETA